MATPCSSDTQLIEVKNSNDALRLAEIVNCTGPGSFFVQWTGRVETPVTIVISNGTWLNVTGLEGGVIDGGNMVQLFSVSSATLSLSDLALEYGNATDGGVLQALTSTVFVTDCNITANFGTNYGGAFALEDTALFLDGNVTFRDNRASSQGGAIRATLSSVVIGGTSRFEENYAGERGGGLALITSCQLNLTGESYFVTNAAGTSGGSIFGIFSDMNISGREAHAYFAGNVAGAEFGGALYWRGEEASINIEAPSYFVNNSSPTAGAIYLAGNGLQASISDTVFESNVASKNGGALVTHVIGLSSSFAVVRGCRFDGNIAELSGGAMVASAGFITVEESIFRHNIADDSGGAILSDGGYTVSAFNLVQTEVSSNQAGTGPAIAQIGNTEDGAARFVTFDGVTFTGNTLLCDDGEFLDQISNETVAEEYIAYDTACSSCSNFTACVNCTVTHDDTVALCYPVLGHTSSPDRDGTLASLELDAGYWRTSNVSSEILQCYNEDACAGGVAEMCGDVNCEAGYCAEGYTGPYCAVCASGYSEGESKTCYPCGGASSQTAEAVGIIGLVALMFLLLWAYNYLTSAGQAQAQDRGQDQGRDGEEFKTKTGSRLARTIPFHAIKILIVAWQIITEVVIHITLPLVFYAMLVV